MVDIKSRSANPLFLREDDIKQGIELLFFAYRDFTSDPDSILKKYGFGRAHHRVIHFVGRNEGISVSELLDILKITKQSLSRVLAQLLEEKYLEQKKGKDDGRQRNLFLTDKGIELEQLISLEQNKRVAKAYRIAGAEAVEGYRKVLFGLLNEESIEKTLSLLEKNKIKRIK
mgnify:CR=1 FL=1